MRNAFATRLLPMVPPCRVVMAPHCDIWKMCAMLNMGIGFESIGAPSMEAAKCFSAIFVFRYKRAKVDYVRNQTGQHQA